ncbi:GAF domain-containing protein [Geomonas sp. Red421]|uniref:histidine kinase n=1 Tax=Geomonas anaerohicana TaxID=2798583 RepID=A0ABS0YC63_9BACT|nr:GAF domain-containing protein [Geomonas anaerohicana]
MFQTMAQGAFYQSADGSLVDVNPAALSLFGLTRDAFLGLTSEALGRRVITEDGAALAPEQFPSMVALRTGEPIQNVLAGVYNYDKHSHVWMSINAIPQFRCGETSPHQTLVTLHDISELKKVNDIHTSRLYLMRFADSHSIDELLVEVLNEVEKLTGSVISFYSVFDEKSRLVTHKAYSTRTINSFCKMPQKEWHYSETSIDKAGVWIDCVINGRPVIHNDYNSLPHRHGLPRGHAPLVRELVVPVKRNGVTVAILGVGNKADHYSEADLNTASLFADLTWDIAERKSMEDALRRSQNQLIQANEDLEQRVIQRTSDLEAAIREQQTFSYSVSHDLRAPLRHINSFSAILLEEHANAIPPEALDYLKRMQLTSSRMGALIDHLLELSRVGRTEIRRSQVHLSDLATSILRMLQETEPHRKVEKLVDPGINCIGDYHLLYQLLANLIGNAWKYTSTKTSATIEFGKTVVSGHETYVVRDNGVGFDMNYRQNLFKAFERLHGSEFEGMGIGLATAYRIIERHGGKIWAEGRVDEGAAVYFTIPTPPEHNP